jgi:hypothetical protein
MKKILFTLIIILSLFFVIQANFVLADNNASGHYGLDTSANQAGLATTNAPTISQVIGMIINAALGLVGVIYLVLTIYSGFQWMTAGGNDETIAKAKKRLVNSAIGLAIIFSAFIITNFIVFRILDITTGNGVSTSQGGGGSNICVYSCVTTCVGENKPGTCSDPTKTCCDENAQP